MSGGGAAPAVITLEGEIDLGNVEEMRSQVEGAIATGTTHVVFDLSAVRFLDSSGLAVFAQTSLRVAHVTLRGVSPLIRRVIDATGLSDVLLVEK